MAPVDIKTAVRKIQEMMRDVTGIEDAPDEPLEDYISLPFVASYASAGGTSEPLSGTTAAAGGKKEEHFTIFTEVHLDRGLGPEAIERALDLHGPIADVLCRNINLEGTVDTIRYPIRHSFGRLDWGNQENVHIGWRFEIDVKLMTDIPAPA